MNPKKITYNCIITIFAIYFNLLIIIFPKEIIKSAKNGLLIWYNFALPSLLPFIIGTNILKSTSLPHFLSKKLSTIFKYIFKISGNGAFPIVCGLLSGYPLGAKMTCEMYMDKTLSKTEAQRILCFANNSGPIFIIGTVATQMLHNTEIGYYLLGIHILSALLVGFIIGLFFKTPKKAPTTAIENNISIGELLSTSINNGLESIVAIGGYIVFFSILLTMLTKTNIINFLALPFNAIGLDDTASKGLISGLLEITNGCNLLSQCHNTSLPLIIGIISWGGLSIHAQSIGFISKAKLSPKPYILAKLFQGVIAGFLCIIIL